MTENPPMPRRIDVVIFIATVTGLSGIVFKSVLLLPTPLLGELFLVASAIGIIATYLSLLRLRQRVIRYLPFIISATLTVALLVLALPSDFLPRIKPISENKANLDWKTCLYLGFDSLLETALLFGVAQALSRPPRGWRFLAIGFAVLFCSSLVESTRLLVFSTEHGFIITLLRASLEISYFLVAGCAIFWALFSTSGFNYFRHTEAFRDVVEAAVPVAVIGALIGVCISILFWESKLAEIAATEQRMLLEGHQ